MLLRSPRYVSRDLKPTRERERAAATFETRLRPGILHHILRVTDIHARCFQSRPRWVFFLFFLFQSATRSRIIISIFFFSRVDRGRSESWHAARIRAKHSPDAAIFDVSWKFAGNELLEYCSQRYLEIVECQSMHVHARSRLCEPRALITDNRLTVPRFFPPLHNARKVETRETRLLFPLYSLFFPPIVNQAFSCDALEARLSRKRENSRRNSG